MARDAAGGVGCAAAGRYVTLGTAVVILLILAAIASNLRDPGRLPAILFAAAAAVAVVLVTILLTQSPSAGAEGL